MAEVTLTINGKNFGVSCDDGQESRVIELAHYVDSRLKDIAAAGAATSENHLLVLTSLMLSDEIFDLRAQLESIGEQITSQEDEDSLKQDDLVIAQAIDHLAERIDNIASRIQKA